MKKKRIKELGPDRPYLQIHQQSSDRGRAYTRGFSSTYYGKRTWLAGCDCKRHESSRSHLDNAMRLQIFGKLSIAQQLDEGYRIGIRRHNEEVTKNRHILSRIIDCVKFCGAFELALRGHDESEGSDNPGIFRGLVDFVASLDGVLKEHLENATVFKGTSKTVQNELLDCMLSVADETTDIATQCQLVLVLRYIDAKSNVQERFFEFIPLRSTTADSIATVLKERLAVILPEDQKSKLISQTYDGASVMRGATAGFSSFFSRSPKRTDVLDKVVAHRLPTSSNVRWNFHSRAINTVFEHREDLIRCFQSIRDSGDFDPVTVREAGAFAMLLENQDFKFFLQLFHNIMPHVDLLYAKLQKKDIDSVHIRGSIQQFQQDIQKIRNSLHSLVDQCSEGGSQPKRRRSLSPEVYERIAAEVCDTILRHTLERFSFTDHLVSATLLQADRFEQYTMAFPEDALSRTLKAYPVLDGSKLKTELSLIYCKEEFRACCGALDLLQLFMENNLEEVFSETVTLLKILVTTPMTTAEAERCFSTLKRIKTFLRNSMTQERLNALAMLSIEKRLVTEMTDFNQKVIEKFASQKERRAKFVFK
ncbi:Zinc finger MYM-type protein 1 [Labeo rohita]|uniref:Zinc finger MYM-type protein 1 n=2 Tax=Labeo rohita TaxID=84645 RepID=A0ABQ8L6X2_LABRO|nr:Zinc finger MYM-type protein 1 [Labeo rohita]